MAKNKSTKVRIIEAIDEYPDKTNKELYKIANIKTSQPYFNITYNIYKHNQLPQSVKKLEEEYPLALEWINKNYSDTKLLIKDIADKFNITAIEVIHIKDALGLIKKYTVKKGFRPKTNSKMYCPKKPKINSLNLSVGDIINVTKHRRVTPRDVFTLGRSEVIYKNKHYIAIKDARGHVHGFSKILLHEYIEYT